MTISDRTKSLIHLLEGMDDMSGELSVVYTPSADTVREKAIEYCKEIIEYTNTNSGFPSPDSKDPVAKGMGLWLVATRALRNDSDSMYRDLYPVLDEIANAGGYPDMFMPEK